MIMRSALLMIVTLCLVLGTPFEQGPVFAAKFNRVLDIGTKAPEWKNLRGTDGKTHSLSDLERAKAVVVIFTCNHCPVAQAYQERFIRLATQYRRSGVEVVAISVSRYAADDFESMKKRADELKYPFTYLQDATQKLGRAYGALWTPQVFVLDGRRRIVYMGAVDDSMHAGKVKKRFLQDALDAVIAGKPVEVEETKPVGCPIDYE